MTTDGRQSTRLADESGFALLSVLLAVGVLTGLLVSIERASRATSALLSAENRVLQARELADAGIYRVLASVSYPNDPLWDHLGFDREPYIWSFGTGRVRISVTDARTRIDLNGASPVEMSQIAHTTFPNGTLSAEFMTRWRELKAGPDPIRTPLAPLPSPARFSQAAEMVQQQFTTYVPPRDAPGSGKTTGTVSRSVWTIRAEALGEDGQSLARREAIVSIAGSGAAPRIVLWRNAVPLLTDTDGLDAQRR